MSRISFVDDNMVLAESFITRDYSTLSENIKKDKEKLSEYVERDGRLAGYIVVRNSPLSELFHDQYWVVRFVLADFQTEHVEMQAEMLDVLFQRLNSHIESEHGYYNLRLPSHVVDILKAYNKVFQRGYFCGGTVEEIIYGKEILCDLKEGLSVFWADEDYLNKYRQEMLDMTFKSFDDYHGQYHISPITESGAGKIYENWIRYSLDQRDANIVVADYLGSPVGFITIDEKDHAMEGVLNAVDEQYRNLGIYRAMLAYVVNSAVNKGKSFVISTQMDNFVVQGVWNSMGLKPFYSIYNFHIDQRG